MGQYLAEEHWARRANRPEDRQAARALRPELPIATGAFTIDELNFAIHALKKGKAPGPDNTTAEVFKILSEPNRQTLLDHINNLWDTENVTQGLTHAIVVTLYKKGNSRKPQNYRPISLLNIIWKILGIMLRTRIAEHADPLLAKTQHGFRSGKSTAQALHLVRRITDLGEASQDNYIVIFLDWEKAFDKLYHDRMGEALTRFGIPAKIVRFIRKFYESASFQAKMNSHTSNVLPQETGIRQGCPLSPFLFILVLDVIMTDAKFERINIIRTQRPVQINFDEVLFADDTALISASTRGAHALLHAIETHAEYHGLRLNKQKCAAFAMNRNNRLRFLDGTPIDNVEEVKYLGCHLNSRSDYKRELQQRIRHCTWTMKTLAEVWKGHRCSTQWKLRVYEAVVLSRLLYGLETVTLTNSLGKCLEVMHIRQLRQILKLPTTFMDRYWTNERVRNKAAEEKREGAEAREQPNVRTWPTIAERLGARQLTLLGHIIRAGPIDPLFQVSFADASLKSSGAVLRRVGKPKYKWIDVVKAAAWRKWNDSEFDDSAEQREQIRL